MEALMLLFSLEKLETIIRKIGKVVRTENSEERSVAFRWEWSTEGVEQTLKRGGMKNQGLAGEHLMIMEGIRGSLPLLETPSFFAHWMLRYVVCT
jgi:hypothetical protein